MHSIRTLVVGRLPLSFLGGTTTLAVAEEKTNYSEGLKDAAVVIGAGVAGVGAAIAAGVVINNRLDQANAAADKRNEQLDQQLKDQKAELCRQSGRYCND